jgi:hypothetical protein
MKTNDDSIEKQKDAVNASDAEISSKVAGGNDKIVELRASSHAAWGDLKTGVGLAWQSLSKSAGRARPSGLGRLVPCSVHCLLFPRV